MKELEISNLIQLGATDKVRIYFKKLTIPERMKALHKIIPYINANQKSVEFFRSNFSKEIGALIMTDYDYDEAVRLYRTVKV